MKTLLLIYILTFTCYPQISTSEIVGIYSQNSGFTQQILELNSDNTFQYRYFFDVGGWRLPIHGNWKIKSDTIFLFSSPLPEIQEVKESESSDSVITITVYNREREEAFLYPQIKLNGWHPDYDPSIHVISTDSVKFGPFLVSKNEYNSPINNIKLYIGNFVLSYIPSDKNSDTFELILNLTEDEIFNEIFFDNEPYLYLNNMLYQRFNGEFVTEYPLIKVKKQ